MGFPEKDESKKGFQLLNQLMGSAQTLGQLKSKPLIQGRKVTWVSVGYSLVVMTVIILTCAHFQKLVGILQTKKEYDAQITRLMVDRTFNGIFLSDLGRAPTK